MRSRLLVLFLAGLVLAGPTPTAVSREGDVVSSAPPRVAGEAVYGGLLRAGPGQWEPSDVTVSYRWLRDGAFVPGARERTYRLVEGDLGHRLAVQVTATDAGGGTGTATSDESAPVQRARFVVKTEPQVVGVLRYSHTVTADPGRLSPSPSRLRYQWLRAGEPIAGATAKRYTFAPDDVGRRVRVEVTASAPGYLPTAVTSEPQPRVGHRVDVRRRVTYSVTTRGHVTAGLTRFERLAQETYDDPRGWRAKGVEFRRVATGGSFTLEACLS